VTDGPARSARAWHPADVAGSAVAVVSSSAERSFPDGRFRPLPPVVARREAGALLKGPRAATQRAFEQEAWPSTQEGRYPHHRHRPFGLAGNSTSDSIFPVSRRMNSVMPSRSSSVRVVVNDWPKAR